MKLHQGVKIAIAVVLLAAVLIAGYCSVINYLTYRFQNDIVEPYNVFRAQEVEAIPQFDQLNKSVADDLPPLPPGVQLEKEHSVGISNPLGLHGRYLYLELLKPTTLSWNFYAYYRTYFLANGWSETWNNPPPSYLYIRNTSCVEIENFSPDINNEYESMQILIWHDFRNLVFSPKVPNIPRDLIGLFEDGKTFFVECPPPHR